MKRSEQVHAIVACSDRRQLPAACVALATASRHVKGLNVRYFVVAEGCGPEDFDAIAAFDKKNAVGIEVLAFKHGGNVGKSYGRGHISSGAYLRLHLDELLPSNLARVLYVDADTTTVDDISTLFTMDLGGYFLAAAPEVYVETRIPDHFPDFFNIRKNGYFTSGVLRFDWRAALKAKFLAKARLFAAGKPKNRFHDQDHLNYTAQANWCRLDQKYNAVIQNLSAGVKPAIAHFANLEKPWLSSYYMRYLKYRAIYRELLAGTPWVSFVTPKTVVGWVIVAWEPVMWWQQRRVGLDWQKLPPPPR